MIDINKERKNAVREAWANERLLVLEGKGSRDWSQSEQREIVAKGQATGYEGHHMQSVKDYPQHAGNSQNIQFLNRSEHISGAHNGNTRNSTNGYYDPKNGTMHTFGNSNPKAPPVEELSMPLTQRQHSIAIKREQIQQQAAKQAKTEAQMTTGKMRPNRLQTQNAKIDKQSLTYHAQSERVDSQSQLISVDKVSTNKGIERMKNKEARAGASSPANPSRLGRNKGIEAMQEKKTTNQAPSQIMVSNNKGISSYQEKVTSLSSAISQSESISNENKAVSNPNGNQAGSNGGKER